MEAASRGVRDLDLGTQIPGEFVALMRLASGRLM